MTHHATGSSTDDRDSQMVATGFLICQVCETRGIIAKSRNDGLCLGVARAAPAQKRVDLTVEQTSPGADEAHV